VSKLNREVRRKNELVQPILPTERSDHQSLLSNPLSLSLHSGVGIQGTGNVRPPAGRVYRTFARNRDLVGHVGAYRTVTHQRSPFKFLS